MKRSSTICNALNIFPWLLQAVEFRLSRRFYCTDFRCHFLLKLSKQLEAVLHFAHSNCYHGRWNMSIRPKHLFDPVHRNSNLSHLQSAQAKDLKTISGKAEFYRLLASYASPMTLSALNFVLPTLFFFLSRLEDWNPRVRVNVDLARSVMVEQESFIPCLVAVVVVVSVLRVLCWNLYFPWSSNWCVTMKIMGKKRKKKESHSLSLSLPNKVC